MKLENVGMMVGFVASTITQEMLEAPLWFEVIGCAGGIFVGWQLGCIADIIWANRNVTDPDPELTDAEIEASAFRKFDAEERAFMAEHETLHNQYEKDYRRRKLYSEDTYMDDDIKNV